jgi:hypothetical protein
LRLSFSFVKSALIVALIFTYSNMYRDELHGYIWQGPSKRPHSHFFCSLPVGNVFSGGASGAPDGALVAAGGVLTRLQALHRSSAHH